MQQWWTIGVPICFLLILKSASLWRDHHFNGGSNKDNISQDMQLLMDELNSSVATIDGLSNEGKPKFRGKRDHELPSVSYHTIEVATEYFSERNKVGHGGYGPVYKGKLVNGQEIAVKRLSKSSGQGLKEFKNEVTLISRLQHRNLVRLLGCCIEREERILIYEYLPNKSLDFTLFDMTKQALLDWKIRVRIIEGIAQGLLYLHKLSRLLIIHRDLKTSNILLDSNMNPKISDFGTAKVFKDNESQANTNRIVGTYGYMPPEYIMGGLFSVKSDVFSFGVMMLEIISGRRNTIGLNQANPALNLPGHAWDLWKEGQSLELIDSSIAETCSSPNEVKRYVQISLLCVQESAADRPTMPEIMSMLSNETLALPAPQRPAFYNMTCVNVSNLPENPEPCSANNVTISEVEAR